VDTRQAESGVQCQQKKDAESGVCVKWRSRLKRIMRTASRCTHGNKQTYDIWILQTARAPQRCMRQFNYEKKRRFFSQVCFLSRVYLYSKIHKGDKSIQLFLSFNASQQTLVSVSKTPRTLLNDYNLMFLQAARALRRRRVETRESPKGAHAPVQWWQKKQIARHFLYASMFFQG